MLVPKGSVHSHESAGRMSSALPPSSLPRGWPSSQSLWPEPVGTGRPSPLALARPRELFWGTFIDGTWVPGWTPDFRGTAAGWPRTALPLHAPPGGCQHPCPVQAPGPGCSLNRLVPGKAGFPTGVDGYWGSHGLLFPRILAPDSIHRRQNPE